MQILQTPVRFFPSTGGVEKYVLDLSQELVKHGNNVKIICANEPKSDIKEYKNIKIKKLNYIFKIANTNLALALPIHLIKENFDVLHAHLPTPWFADWSILIAKLKRKKAILTYHNDITGRGIAKIISKIYNNTFLKLTLRLSDKIIITQPKYLQYSPYLKKFKHKIEIVPNAVNLSKFKPLPEIEKQKNTIFFLSILDEFHKYKGLDYLLAAIKKVKKQIPDVKLIIGGKGKLLDFYKNKTKQLNIQNNVKFHGFIPDNKLIEYYNKFQVFVLPSTDSKQEGFGIVLLEAIACNTPVISTNIVGIAKNIKEFKCGFIVTPKNVTELKNSILKLLQSQKKINQNCLELASKFDIQKTTSKIHKLYLQL